MYVFGACPYLRYFGYLSFLKLFGNFFPSLNVFKGKGISDCNIFIDFGFRRNFRRIIYLRLIVNFLVLY